MSGVRASGLLKAGTSQSTSTPNTSRTFTVVSGAARTVRCEASKLLSVMSFIAWPRKTFREARQAYIGPMPPPDPIEMFRQSLVGKVRGMFNDLNAGEQSVPPSDEALFERN